MSSDEMTSVPSPPSPPRPSSIFSCKSSDMDAVSDEELYSDTVTTISSDSQSEDGNSGPGTTTSTDKYETYILSSPEHDHSRVDLVNERIQDIQHESHWDRFRPRLTFAIMHLRKLRCSFGLDPSKLLEESDAQCFRAVIEEGNVDTVFGVYTDEYVVLDRDVLVNLNQVSADCSIDDEMRHVANLLEIVKSLQTDCREETFVQLLEPNHWSTIVIVYLATILTLNHLELVKSEKLEEFRSLGLLLQGKPTGPIEI